MKNYGEVVNLSKYHNNSYYFYLKRNQAFVLRQWAPGVANPKLKTPVTYFSFLPVQMDVIEERKIPGNDGRCTEIKASVC